MSGERVVAGSAGERFEILGTLGQGAMGQVWRARELASGREVALKLLLRCDALTQARFVREGQLMARLDHPGVVRVHSSGSVEGRPYLACELVEGARTLEDLLESAPPEQRLDWLEQAGEALGAAHALGIVHRDVKLENLLVDGQGRLRLTDFGVATALDLEQLTRTGRAVGTPYTMAPEQVRGRREAISPATDVWALGVLLYLALGDELPFGGDNAVQLAAEILSAEPPPLPAAPPALAELCRRALSSDVAARPADGAAFAAALRAARTGRGEGARPGRALAAGVLIGAAALASALWGLSASSEGAATSTSVGGEASAGEEAGATPAATPAPPPGPSAWERARAAANRGEWRAFELAEQAARGGELAAMVWLGEHLPERAGFPRLQVAHVEAAAWLRVAADAGDAEAQVRLARVLSEGRWFTPDARRATAYYRRAAKQGHPLGLLGYGTALTSSAGGAVERDEAEGEALLERAAASGDPEALAWWGMRRFYHRAEHEEGRALLQRAGEAGCAFAWLQLARTYSGGIGGLTRNPVRYVGCLREAARLGDREGIYQLGRVLFARGEVQEAVPLLRLARGLGRELAATELAIYDLRAGERERGVALLRERAAAGDARACTELALSLMVGDPPAGSPRFREAFELAQQAAPRAPKARLLLGLLWEEAGDLDTARSHFERALARSLPEAALALSRLDEAAGRSADALRWTERAAELGQRIAIARLRARLGPERLAELARSERLFALYLQGQLLFSRPDPALWGRAVAVLSQAAAKGHPPAQVELARAHLCGHGAERDLELARAWLEAATRGEDPEAFYELAQLASREGRALDAAYLLGRARGLGSSRAANALSSRAAQRRRGLPPAWPVCPLARGVSFFLPPDWRAFADEGQSLLLHPPEPRSDEMHRLFLALSSRPDDAWFLGADVAARFLAGAPPGWQPSVDRVLAIGLRRVREVIVRSPDQARAAYLLRVDLEEVGVDLVASGANERLEALRAAHHGIARGLHLPGR